MKKQLLLVLSSTLALVACGGGGGGSSGGSTPPTTDNYTLQSTVTAPSGTFTSAGSSGSSTNSAYLATSSGFYNVSGNTASPVSAAPGGITVVAGNGSTVYYVPNNSYAIYNANGSELWNIGSGYGYITAVSQSSSNGSTFYGTYDGYVGLVNNPAGKTISQITTLPSDSQILAIGCIAGGSCNSGKQGVMALAGLTSGFVAFESSSYANAPSTWTYPSSFYYYNGVGSAPGWYAISNYNGSMASGQSFDTVAYYSAESNPGNMVNPTALGTATLPEFVTSVTFNNGNIYVGTNLFNIYSVANYSCNNGQLKNGGCPVTFTGPLNVNSNGTVIPLGWIQNGSIGIVSLTVQSNGQLMAISQESPTYTRVYVSDATSY